jgi:cytosine/adenosine deaminase-related metal-dependent hydrolase
MTGNLLIRNVRPKGDPAIDILISDGTIAAIGPNLAAPGIPALDGAGGLALPGLVEAHTHLDKTLLGMPWYRNAVGLPDYGLAPGYGGDIVLIDAERVAEAVAQHAGGRVVVKRGLVVA